MKNKLLYHDDYGFLRAYGLVIILLLNVLALSAQNDLDSIIALSHQGQYEQANQLFEKYNASSVNDIKGKIAQAYNYSWWGRYEQAEDLFLSALKEDPKHPEALEGAAYNFRFSQDYPKSVQYFNILVNVQADHLGAHKGLVYNYLDTDKIDGAAYFLNKAFKLAPYDEELFYLQGLIKIKRQDFSGARAAFQHSVDINTHYTPALDQLSRMVSNPARWEITPWAGATRSGNNTKTGLRRVDLFFNASSDILLYGFWDNSLSFENNFLLQNRQEASLFGAGSAIRWKEFTTTNGRLSHWNIPGQDNLWDVRIEQNFFIKNKWRIQAGGQFVFNNTMETRIISLTNEVSITDHFNLEVSLFSNHNYRSATDITTLAVVPKFFLGKNIEFLSGVVLWNGDPAENSSMITYKGMYGMLSFPIIDHVFSRIIYVKQKEQSNDIESLALGISVKF